MKHLMDWDTFRNAVIVINTIGLAAVTFLTWLRKPGDDAAKAVGSLREEILDLHRDLNGRMTTLEERVQHMPTGRELSQLQAHFQRLEAQNQGQSDRLNSMHAALTRIESFLLNRS